MALNRKCPKCGSDHVQLSNEKSKHGCFWTLLFGVVYICWVFIIWMIGCIIFICYDWWLELVPNKCNDFSNNRSYRWTKQYIL